MDVGLDPAPNRASIDGLGRNRALVAMLPALYQEDEFSNRWLGALDSVVAPVELSIDCFADYLDPELTPPDFLRWLGSWLGAIVDDEMTTEQQRLLVGSIVEVYGLRGTPLGIRRLLELSLPARCDVIEGGAAVSSELPSPALPGSAAQAFVVRVAPIDSATNELTDHQKRRAELLVEIGRPAHLPAVVEFVESLAKGA